MDRDKCTALFESKVIKTSGCWLHSGSRGSHGYPQATGLDGKSTTAHRVAWTLYRGDIPPRLFICHKCDNRLCVNPEHLYPGTHRENMRDMRVRERNIRKITRSQADAIRADNRPQRKIAAEYGVSQGTVFHIKSGRTHY